MQVWKLSLMLLALGAGGCRKQADEPTSQAKALEGRAPNSWYGVCDGSAAIALPGGWVLVAEDEGNALRAYDPARPDAVFESQSLKNELQLDGKKEVDIEGAAVVGGLTFWIGSHGRNPDGLERPNRKTLFATTNALADGKLTVVVKGFYKGLLADLLSAPALAPYKLAEAEAHAPEEGGINIEGIARGPNDSLFVGFRSPLRADGTALVVPIANPMKLVAGDPQVRAELGEPIALDLGGSGIRDLVYSDRHATWFLIAGPAGKDGKFALYRWNNDGAKPVRLNVPELGGFRPEALVVESDKVVRLLSDDGDDVFAGESVKCKDLKDDSKKHFRWMMVDL